MKLKKSERQQQILSEFRASPSTRLGDLADLLEVSKETIRRDITEMSEKGLLSRTYGGAVASSLNYEPQMRDRMRINPTGRRRMADLAASLVAGLPVIMIDSGSTMATVAERIAHAVPRSGKIPHTPTPRRIDSHAIAHLRLVVERGGDRTAVGARQEPPLAHLGDVAADRLLADLEQVGEIAQPCRG